jgi:hypothetical protein
MIAEPAARFAALEVSRRAEELLRLRDLTPAVADPAPATEHGTPAQPGEEGVAPAPAASTEAPPVVAEAVPAAASDETPPAGAEAAPAPATIAKAALVAEAAPAAVAEASPVAVAEQAPAPDTPGAQPPEDSKLTAEPPVESEEAAPPVVAPLAALERVAAAPTSEAPASEAPATAEQSEPAAELPAAAPQQLALADIDAVPDPEPSAKLAARTGEPEEAPPFHRVAPHYMPRLMARLPRVLPSLSRLSARRLAPVPPRIASARHVHTRARAEADKAVVVPRKPVRHVIRPVHRARRASVAPSTVLHLGYSVTSGIQYS